MTLSPCALLEQLLSIVFFCEHLQMAIYFFLKPLYQKFIYSRLEGVGYTA